MNRGHDKIKCLQNLIRIVQRPIPQNVALNAFQDREVRPGVVEGVNFLMLLFDPLNAEAIGIMSRSAVSRYAKIAVALVATGGRHFG